MPPTHPEFRFEHRELGWEFRIQNYLFSFFILFLIFFACFLLPADS